MSSPTSVPTASRILPACPSSGVREANGNSVEQEIRRYETPLNGIDGQAELLEDGDSEKDGIVVISAYRGPGGPLSVQPGQGPRRQARAPHCAADVSAVRRRRRPRAAPSAA